MPLLVAFAQFLLARHASLWLHELAHAAAALLAGAKVTAVRVPLLGGNSFTSTAGAGRAEAFVRHAGWICSVYVAGLAARTLTLPCAVAALLVAAEAVVSDLFALERYRSSAGTFYCGNFGIIVLDRAHAHRVPQLLRSMINVTMMRGAQCAGLVSYSTDRNDNSTAARSRVVNGKRTDLCEKLLSQRRTRAMLGAATRRAPDGGAPLVFQGHTRFATSSIVNLGGCHPHRWTAATRRTEWRFVVGGGGFAAAPRNVEGYVTHNGDLDFFTLNGVCYSVRISFGRAIPRAIPPTRPLLPPRSTSCSSSSLGCCTRRCRRPSTRSASPASSISCAPKASGITPSATATFWARSSTRAR